MRTQIAPSPRPRPSRAPSPIVVLLSLCLIAPLGAPGCCSSPDVVVARPTRPAGEPPDRTSDLARRQLRWVDLPPDAHGEEWTQVPSADLDTLLDTLGEQTAWGKRLDGSVEWRKP